MPQPQALPGIGDDYQSKFFSNDVVTRLDDPTFRGKVLRCWADEEMASLPPIVGVEKILDRPLLRGEIGLANLVTSELSISPESIFKLHQRDFLKGDIVKKTLTSVESAVVIGMKTEVMLEDALTGTSMDDWVELERLCNCLMVEAGDRVVVDQWVGTVEEVFEDALVQPVVGQSYRLAEMGGLLEPGRTVAEVMPQEPGYEIPKSRFPPNSNDDTDRITSVRPIIVFVTWNAINQMLPITEQKKYPEPPRFWYGFDLARLIHFDMSHDQPQPVGSAVKFKCTAQCIAYGFGHRVSGVHDGLNVIYRVGEARSKLRLRWQDGSETEEWSKDVVPYHNIDDYEAWPGEHIIWRDENGEKRPAVLQNFNPHQRIAQIRLLDPTNTGEPEIQTIPVLEIDPGKPGKEAYGVSHGSQVLLCNDNGSSLPHVPTLGQVDHPGDDFWWRSELAGLCEVYEAKPDDFGQALPSTKAEGVDWWGEVVDLKLDGSVDVLLANGETRNVGVKQLCLLAESMPVGMGMGTGMGMEGEYPPDMGMGGAGPIEYFMDLHGALHQMAGDGDEDMKSQASWQTISSRDGVLKDGEVDTEEDGESSRDVEEIDPMESSSPLSQTIPLLSTPATADRLDTGESGDWPEAGPSSPSPRVTASTQDDQWIGFEMLEEAPSDHHFFAEPRLQSSNKAYLSRLRKEHKALSGSLPENILVRTYEDRTDLMRCLIIGPEGTPYVDAPFVFDIYLNPTKFPQEPPMVHFHSHTNGKGRCNPNLYEDGKVCLSILGTWSGEQSESWSPSSSSLLQVFVSISGLVLVRKPYHCEPAFAKLEGTTEGSINSRLYSEKAYILSRSFVKTALERPPMGLEKELRWFYLGGGGGLRKVVDHAEMLMRRAESEGTGGVGGVEKEAARWDGDSVGDLSMGAVISLKRTIASLNHILEEQQSKARGVS